MAAGRFKSKSGIYPVGKVRLTDWRPVREECDHHDDQNTRSDQSEDEYDSEEEEDEVRVWAKFAAGFGRFAGEA